MQIADKYAPQQIESKWYDYWIEQHIFHSEPDQREPYTIVIPPPNVTGMLHMGHMLNNTLQDVLIRRARMSGKNACWVPGMDHASIATEAKVVAMLHEKGIEKSSLTREEFLEYAWEWKEKYGGMILRQLRKLGASCDWERTCFTMDEPRTESVIKVFCDLYEKGKIYRGVRMVNWDPAAQTALSDEEVVFKESHGKLYYLRYMVEGSDKAVIVATTRPETILGDTALCVNPNDPRYGWLPAGARVIVPLVNRAIPVIRDEYVDIEFGTGALKVTPAHDVNDYMLGEKYNLEVIDIFNDDGTINDKVGMYVGQDRFDVRRQIEKDLDAAGLLEKTEDYTNNVGYSERTGVAIEPKLSMQWFLSMQELAEPATKAVMEDAIRFVPEKYKNTYRHWMENIKDWCISRQLWWGHRIPVFHCEDCGWEDALMEDTDVCPKCGSHHVAQEEDVLDTWFSSQLWTFATQGWPEHPERLEGHHPTTALVTARDIIALWVARMIMSSTYFLKEIPFKDVVIYATILAKDGTRMSKSKGNGVDPMDLISMYGADAMRFNLLTLVTNNQDVRFDADIDKKTHELLGSPRTESARAFVTKIWNASRFVLGNLDGFTPGEPRAVSQADAWIFSRLAKLSAEVTKDIETYQFGEMARELHAFFWNEFCDWYIEFSKASLREEGDARLQTQRNLVYVLDNALRLLHPAMPFVTEAIWENVPHAEGEAPALMMAKWPEPESLASLVDEESERAVSLLCDVVSAVRSTRARYGISPKQELPVVLRAEFENARVLEGLKSQIISMSRASELSIVPSDAHKPAESACVVAHGCEVYCVLTGLIDFEAERARLTKERATLQKDEAKFAKKLSNPGFLAKAAPEIVEKDTAKLAELRDKLARVEEQLAELG